jgi:hypothetical protein
MKKISVIFSLVLAFAAHAAEKKALPTTKTTRTPAKSRSAEPVVQPQSDPECKIFADLRIREKASKSGLNETFGFQLEDPQSEGWQNGKRTLIYTTTQFNTNNGLIIHSGGVAVIEQKQSDLSCTAIDIQVDLGRYNR